MNTPTNPQQILFGSPRFPRISELPKSLIHMIRNIPNSAIHNEELNNSPHLKDFQDYPSLCGNRILNVFKDFLPIQSCKLSHLRHYPLNTYWR